MEKFWKDWLKWFSCTSVALIAIFALERKDIINFVTITPEYSGVIVDKFYEIGGSVHNVKQQNYILLDGSNKPILVDSYTYQSKPIGSQLTIYKEDSTVYLIIFVSLIIVIIILMLSFILKVLTHKSYMEEMHEIHKKTTNKEKN